MVEGGKVAKSWHVVSGDESKMTKLEQEWEKIQMHTSWVIKPCLSHVDDIPEGMPSNPPNAVSGKDNTCDAGVSTDDTRRHAPQPS